MGCLCSSSVQSLLEKRKRSSSLSITQEELEDIEKNRDFFSDYELTTKIIGTGSHGAVKLCNRKKKPKEFAVKIIKKSSIEQKHQISRQLYKLVHSFKSLNHPAILKMRDFYEDSENYYIIMDYINAGDLFERIQKHQKFCETCAARIMKQVFSGISYLHSKKIIHRDIKLENLLIEENKEELLIKIIDFESCTNQIKTNFCERQGSLPYMSPEVILGKYNEKCDVWSAGVCLFVLLTGQYPFVGYTKEEIEDKILYEDFDGCALNGISNEAVHLIRRLLEKNQNKRFSAAEAARHGWILRNSYGFVEGPLRLSGYNPYSHGLKLWALQFVLNDNELVHFELAFMQADLNSDGFIDAEELVEYLKIVSVSEALVIISHGFWTQQNKLNFYEFISVMADRVFWENHFSQILGEFPLVFPITQPTLNSFLSSKLNGESRIKSQSLPSSITDQDFYTLITY